MRRNPLGRTALTVSECLLGTATLATRGRDPAVARAAVERALDRGIDAIEIDAGDDGVVALVAGCGLGHEVRILARAAARVPFPLPSPHVPAQRAYPGADLRAQVDRLLATLKVERLALVQLHAWCPEWLHEGDWLDTLARLRDTGKIAGIGVSLFDHDIDAGLEAVADGRIDALQVMVNPLDPGALPVLLPLCRANDVAVVARSPLYYGALAMAPGGGMRGFDDRDWRAGYFFPAHAAETAARVARLGDAAAASGTSLAELALRFPIGLPAVAGVAVGLTTPAQVDAAIAAIAHGPLDADTRASLAGHAWLC